MESAIENTQVALAEVAFAIWPKRGEDPPNFVQILGINWPSIEIASTELSTHGFLFPPSRQLTLVEYPVHFPHVGLVIDHAAFDFDPGMCFQWNLLGPEDHLSWNSVLLQETGGCS